MRTVVIASIRAHTRRYLAAFLTVAVAVGFVVATNALTSAVKDSLSAGVEQAYPSSDLVVGKRWGISDTDLDRALAVAERHDDRTVVVGGALVAVQADGRSLGGDLSVGTVSEDPDVRRQDVVVGRAPRTDAEVLVDRTFARSDGLQVGDTLTVSEGTSRRDMRVVGLAASATYLGADLYAPWSAVRQWPGASADSLVYDVRDGTVDRRRAELADAVGSAQVRTRDAFVADRVQVMNQGVDIVGYLVLLFAAIAGFVSVLVIANTFTIMFAQRTRDLALLRCVGATRAQLVRSVRLETLVLALMASLVGVVGGATAGYGLAAIGRAVLGPDRVGAVTLSPAWMVSALVGGLVTTSVAAWWPTRSVVRVSPLAALRPAETPTIRTRSGRVRTGLGSAVLAGSALVLSVAVAHHELAALLVGGMASFVGVLLLGPVLVPTLLRVTGAAVGRLGPAVRIAAANTVRNPRRSAATTASLLVGVTLTTAALTGVASAQHAVDGQLEVDRPVDVTLTGDRPVSGSTLAQVSAVRGVREARPVDGVQVTVGGIGRVPLIAPSIPAKDLTRRPAAVTARTGEVVVPLSAQDTLGARRPATLTIRTEAGATTLRARYVGSQWDRALLTSPATLARIAPDAAPVAVWVRAEPGVDPDRLGGDVGAVGRGAGLEVTNALKDQAWVGRQFTIAVGAVLALLAVSIGIALVGIANTVGLSVLERGREHALLRALGLTRRQLRRVLAAEGLLLSAVAAAVGTVLGVVYGWLGVMTLVRMAVPDAPVVLPWAQLATVVVVAAFAGLAACVLPARRAARVAPAQGLTLD